MAASHPRIGLTAGSPRPPRWPRASRHQNRSHSHSLRLARENPLNSRIEALCSTRTLLTGVLWNGLGRVLPIIVALLTTPVLIRHLGIDRWALFTLALSLAGSFGILDFGVSAALTRALAERIGTPEEREAPPIIVVAIALLTLTSSASAILVWIFTSQIIDHLLNVPPGLRQEAINAFHVLCLSGPLIVVNSALWGVLSAFQRFRAVILSNIPVSVLYYVGPMAILLIRDNLAWVIATLVVARLLQAIICGVLVLRVVPGLRNWPRFDMRLLKPLLRIGAWVTVSNVLWPVMLYVDRFVVGATLSLAAVSYYSTSLDLVMRLLMVPMAVAAVLFPAVATSHRTMPERTRALLRTGVLATATVVFPACAILAGLSHELLSLWLGARFAVDGGTVLTIVAVGMYLNCIAIMPGTLTDAIGRPEIGTITLLVQAVLFRPVVMLMAVRFGIEGAAWTLRALLNCAARLLICRRLGPAASPVVSKLLIVSFGGAAALVLCASAGPLALRLAAVLGLSIAVPVVNIGLLLEASELAQVRQFVRNRLPGVSAARPVRQT